MKSSISDVKADSPYTDLTPVDNADPGGTYTAALSFALENPRVKNIALTGPYGSGKSSIIRTYEKNSDYKFLNISLASFKEDKTAPVSTTLIERSILQQMLYGADANKLPYSRFKRISTPENPLVKSLILVLWIIASVYLLLHPNDFHNIEVLSLSWLGWALLVLFVVSLPVVVISEVYKASFGLSLSKFSLKNAAIEIEEISENSILNRHLDEIIYFFQATNYNVVVIEDLDRFGDPDIFVKLREINKLINDNEKTDGRIKFLYALKDDMFAHEDRAKFFDFIIPVVPIINSSNSLDKMQERLKEHDFAKSIDEKFLRDVSFYINDLRLIHNIFNEFVIYYEHLKSDNLNVTKLLSMMIYKNVYPNDFESLHHSSGVLYSICNKKYEFIRDNKIKLKQQLDDLRSTIKLSINERAQSVNELINSYIGHIVIHAGRPVYGIISNGNRSLPLSHFASLERFKLLINESSIHITISPPNQGGAGNKYRKDLFRD